MTKRTWNGAGASEGRALVLPEKLPEKIQTQDTRIQPSPMSCSSPLSKVIGVLIPYMGGPGILHGKTHSVNLNGPVSSPVK